MSYDKPSRTTTLEQCPERVILDKIGRASFQCQKLDLHPGAHETEYGFVERRHRVEWWTP